MIAVSTYSGECDGLGYAAEMAGIEVAAYCEADPKRRAKLAEKHPAAPIFQTDEELTADALQDLGIHPDIIFGGPPCQPFSVAGAKRGTADSRHRWPQMLRLVQECRPRWVFVENVGNFVNMALDLVWADLENEGYETDAVVLPALAVGAPHRRDRCFVVAHSWGDGSKNWSTAQSYRENASADKSVNSDFDRVPDTIGSREPQQSGDFCQGRGWPTNGGQGVAHSSRTEQNRPITDGNAARGPRFAISRSMGNTQCGRCKRDNGRGPMPQLTERYKGAFWWAAESRLGRVLDGVSHRLDQVMATWPAWRGQDQYCWEPPRTVQGLKDRPRRIESLGLAVVPWQVYPLFALIREMDDILSGRSADDHATRAAPCNPIP